MRPLPPAARRHYLWSRLLVERATRDALASRSTAPDVVRRAQVLAAVQGQTAVGQMLTEQHFRESRQAMLNPAAFTTQPDIVSAMLDQAKVDVQFARIVGSLVADAGRSAEGVATTVTPRTGYVRNLSGPSCSRCAILAGRVYRYSTGFQRHPHCDCTMVPTALASPAFHPDPLELIRQGQVTGLSVADRKAIGDGADLSQIVNVRSSAAGLKTSGRVLARAGRPTPEAIYRSTTSRESAIEALISAGYARS